jgi:hypothetical protein
MNLWKKRFSAGSPEPVEGCRRFGNSFWSFIYGKARRHLHWLWFSGACVSLRIHDVGQRKEFSHNWDWRRRRTNRDGQNPSRLPTSIRVVSLMKGTPLNKALFQPLTDFEAEIIQLLFHTEVRRFVEANTPTWLDAFRHEVGFSSPSSETNDNCVLLSQTKPFRYTGVPTFFDAIKNLSSRFQKQTEISLTTVVHSGVWMEKFIFGSAELMLEAFRNSLI